MLRELIEYIDVEANDRKHLVQLTGHNVKFITLPGGCVFSPSRSKSL